MRCYTRSLSYTAERGSVLLPVVVAIVLLASITFMLSNQAVNQTNIVSGEVERDRLRYVAEAGLAHAKLQLARNSSCDNYADIPKTDFAGETYSVAISPNKGSPIKIKSSVELQDGKTLNINSQDIAAYEPATTVILQLGKTDGKDVMIDSFYPNANYGSIDDLTVRSGSWIQRPLLEFDLAEIPANVNIISATLDLELRTVTTPGVIGVHRLTRSWEEGTGKGTGNADGATWNDYDGDNPWSQPGGDFGSTLYATAYVSSAKNGQRVTWDIRDLVDGWVSGGVPNYGLMLAEDGTVNNAEFQSREEPDPAAAPRLTIVYACECGKTCEAAPPAGKNVLLVVVDPGNLTTQETAKQALMESWGHTVTLIDESASQTEYDDTVAANDVAYVAEDITSGTLGTKLREATIGVVIEEEKITDEFGISTGETTFTESSIEITDNTHYITENFNLGPVAFASSAQPVGGRSGTLAPGLAVLAVRPSSTTSMLDVLETGAALADTGTAAGRRVKLPWGGNDFDINALTDDGRTIMQRAIEWGAGDGALAPTLPIAHWKFDETSGTTAVDSAGGHDGTLVGNASWAPGVVDGGLSLDGSGDRVDVSGLIDSPSSLTIAGWVNLTSTDINGANMIDLGDNILMRLDNIFYDTYVSFWNGSSWQRTRTGQFLAGSGWRHVAYTHDDAADQQYFYIDGVEAASTTFSTSISYSHGSNTTIGAHSTGNSNYDFNGQIDDLRIYDFALTAAEIAELATPPSTAPIAHWKLDDGVGTTAIDSEGGHDGTLVNGPTWVAGQIGDALDFDGSNDLVSVPHQAIFTQVPMTVSAWFKLNTLPSTRSEHGTIIDKRHTVDPYASWTLYVNETLGDKIRFQIRDSSETGYWLDSAASAVTNTWYHVAGTIDESYNAKLYVNGALEPDDDNIGSLFSSDDEIRIGAGWSGGNRLDGVVDDVRYYDRALSAAEISGLYTAGAGGGGGGGGGGCDGNFRDNFDARAWNGSNGTLSWATDWIEVGESNGPTSGDIQVMNDQSNYQLRTRDNDNGGEGVEREADLSGAATATLSYDYRRMNLDNADDYTSVQVSANGASGPWQELTRHDGSGNDSTYQPASHDITDYKSANTRVRFITSSSMGGTDTVWFDNVEIACTP